MNLDDYLTNEPESSDLCIYCKINKIKSYGYCSEECKNADLR